VNPQERKNRAFAAAGIRLVSSRYSRIFRFSTTHWFLFGSPSIRNLYILRLTRMALTRRTLLDSDAVFIAFEPTPDFGQRKSKNAGCIRNGVNAWTEGGLDENEIFPFL